MTPPRRPDRQPEPHGPDEERVDQDGAMTTTASERTSRPVATVGERGRPNAAIVPARTTDGSDACQRHEPAVTTPE